MEAPGIAIDPAVVPDAANAKGSSLSSLEVVASAVDCHGAAGANDAQESIFFSFRNESYTIQN